jgi:hypothetical protein
MVAAAAARHKSWSGNQVIHSGTMPGSVTVLNYALSARDKEAASQVLEAALIRNVAATVIVCTE